MLSKQCATMLILFLLVSASCKKEVDIKVEIDATNHRGEVISDAKITLDEKQIGTTDDKGHFSGTVKVLQGTKAKFSVTKENHRYYYAPYYETLAITKDSPNIAEFKAVLYNVPKPDGNMLEENIKSNVLTSKKEERKDAEAPTATLNAVDPIAPSETQQNPPQSEPVAEENNIPPANPIEQASEAKATIEKVAEAKPTKSKVVFHANTQLQALPKTKILLVTEENETPELLCETNTEGLCEWEFIQEEYPQEVKFLATNKDFQTASMNSKLHSQLELTLNLTKGTSLDVFALSKMFSHSRRLLGVEVSVNNKKVGKTDHFGFLSTTMVGPQNDLIMLTLSTDEFLPEKLTTSFVLSSQLTITQYFTPKIPPSAKITLLKASISGDLQSSKMMDLGKLDQQLQHLAQKHFFSQSAFREYPFENLSNLTHIYKLRISQLVQSGWYKSFLKNKVDLFLQPILVKDKETFALELSFIDSKGNVLLADKEKIVSATREQELETGFKELSNRLRNKFPFEGAVLEEKNNTLTLNIGEKNQRGLKPHETFLLYGMITSKDGKSKNYGYSGKGKIISVKDNESQGVVEQKEPRAVIARGTSLVLVRNTQRTPSVTETKPPSMIKIFVIESASTESEKPISHASIYANSQWLGSTNERGLLQLPTNGINFPLELKIIKNGFQSQDTHLNETKDELYTIPLQRTFSSIKIASIPPNALVLVDQEELGKTPITSPLKVPSGFVTVEIKAPSGFKNFKQIYEMDAGNLDLTGEKQIRLELDHVTAANQLLSNGNIEQAIKKLSSVPKEHSDYLLAQSKIGEIYLSSLNKPLQACQAFDKVTSTPEVANFQDKRFIHTFILEGMALYLSGEELLKENSELALAHFHKAHERLVAAEPFLRFVGKEDFEHAQEILNYYKAMSVQKTWENNQNPDLLKTVYNEWEDYLSKFTPKQETQKINEPFLENARIYFKQAKTTLSAPSQNKML